jgi:hypothetical protein
MVTVLRSRGIRRRRLVDVTPLFLLTVANGEPADPSVFVGDGVQREVGDRLTGRDGSRWRIVAVYNVSPQLAADGFEARWTVEPLGWFRSIAACESATMKWARCKGRSAHPDLADQHPEEGVPLVVAEPL